MDVGGVLKRADFCDAAGANDRSHRSGHGRGDRWGIDAAPAFGGWPGIGRFGQLDSALRVVDAEFARTLVLRAEGAGFADSVRSAAPRLKALLLNSPG